MEVRQLGPQIGAEITGVDVRTMCEEAFSAIYRAWLDFNVIAVRDQDLTIPEFLAYSRRFGHVDPHPSKSTRHPEFPELTLLGTNKFDAEGKLIQAIYRRWFEAPLPDSGLNLQLPMSAALKRAIAQPTDSPDPERYR